MKHILFITCTSITAPYINDCRNVMFFAHFRTRIVLKFSNVLHLIEPPNHIYIYKGSLHRVKLGFILHFKVMTYQNTNSKYTVNKIHIFNPPKSSGHYTYHSRTLHFLHTAHLCVSYDIHNKERYLPTQHQPIV